MTDKTGKVMTMTERENAMYLALCGGVEARINACASLYAHDATLRALLAEKGAEIERLMTLVLAERAKSYLDAAKETK